jgi:hypothetical protein
LEDEESEEVQSDIPASPSLEGEESEEEALGEIDIAER